MEVEISETDPEADPEEYLDSVRKMVAARPEVALVYMNNTEGTSTARAPR